MLTNAYSTRNEATDAIITAIEAGDATRNEFDIDAIADEIIEQVTTETGQVTYQVTDDTDAFWAAVERHVL
ncbi:MAG: hypothetical protein ACLS2Z_05315 [Actinomyces urogenitalis]|uniref:hypothetical protein n=1 Tax=Actinomyces urogenitalis TaxID=103621 RepID=UPI00205765FE|nr:MAG TPA: hypothetical protein [Caudoviricetes sp.]